jgi:hypothetical protein
MKAFIDPAHLSHLIGLIYDAAIDTARWPFAMEAIRAELNCATSALSLQKMPSGEVLINVTTNIPQHYIDRMPGYAADVLEQWGGADVVAALPIDEHFFNHHSRMKASLLRGRDADRDTALAISSPISALAVMPWMKGRSCIR